MHEAVGGFLDDLKHRRGLSPHTLRSYRSDLDQLTSFLAEQWGEVPEGIHFERVDALTLRSFLAQLHRRATARSSIARKLAALRSFFRYLLREGQIDSNPARGVATPRLDKKLPARLEENEVEAMLTAPDVTTPLGRRDRAILELIYATGLRVGELVGLDQAAVDFSEMLVRVLGKGGKERIVPFGEPAAQKRSGDTGKTGSLWWPADPEPMLSS